MTVDTQAFRDHRVVLVTGAAGFFASFIAARLLKDKKHVVVFDKLNSETTDASEKNENLERLKEISKSIPESKLSIYVGNLLEENDVKKMLNETKPTAVVHAASLVDDRRSVKHPTQYLQVNVIGTQMLLQAIVDIGTVTQFVYISTRSTFGQVNSPNKLMKENELQLPINPYGASKVGAEALCHVYHHIYGLDVNIIRIFALFGPHGRPDMIPRILVERVEKEEEIVKFGSGEANRDWLYVEDAAECVFKAVHTPLGFEKFNAGTGVGTTLNKLIETAEEVIGKKAVIVHKEVPDGDAKYVGIADISKAERLLGWKPTTSVKEGFKKVHEYTFGKKQS